MEEDPVKKELLEIASMVEDCVADIDVILGRTVDSSRVYVGKDFTVGDLRDMLKSVRFKMVGDWTPEAPTEMPE